MLPRQVKKSLKSPKIRQIGEKQQIRKKPINFRDALFLWTEKIFSGLSFLKTGGGALKKPCGMRLRTPEGALKSRAEAEKSLLSLPAASERRKLKIIPGQFKRAQCCLSPFPEELKRDAPLSHTFIFGWKH